jgi:hypothetical protein
LNDKNEEYYSFNHPSSNKLDVLFAYKINEVYKFQYGMITTSSNTEIEQDTFFKHPIVVIESEKEINKNPNLTQKELEIIIYNNVKKLETIKEKDINNYYNNFTDTKENIDKHLENIDGIFIYGSDILLDKDKNQNPEKENLSINYITTSLFLSAQLMYKPEVKPENVLNLHYFLDKMKSTFFSTKKTVENIGFTSKNISISNDFMKIIKELSKIELNDDFNKNKLELIKILIKENKIPNLYEIIRHIKDRHIEEILSGINNLTTKYFSAAERIRILENFIIGDKNSSFQELNNMKNLIMFLKEDYKFSFSFKERFDNKQNQHQAEEKVNQAEEKASQAEEKASQAEEKVNQAEEKVNQAEEDKKESYKNLKNIGKFEDKEIMSKFLKLNKDEIIKYIEEGIITDKEIINQYSEELNNRDLKNISESDIESKITDKKENSFEPKPERRKNSKKRTEMENLIIENYCISRMNINNKNEEMIKKDFFELIGKEKLLKDKDFNKEYENIKKEGEFYLKIIHLYELDLKKRKKELKPELVGSQYYDKIKTKVEELEKQSDFLIKHKRIKKEDKDTFITFLLNEFKQIENKHFEEKELLLIADKYIKWKIIQTQNKENEIKNNENKTVVNNKTINNDLPILE